MWRTGSAARRKRERWVVKASVVIVNWNRGADAVDAVRSVRSQTVGAIETVVVDNGSTDDSVDRLRRVFPDLEIVCTGENLGCPEGRNRGIARATGDVVFFLDDDGVFEPDVVERTLREFEAKPHLGAVSFKVVDFKSGRPDPPPGDDRAWVDRTFVTFAFRGGACALRRAAIDRVGAYPGEFFRQAEEADLALRLHAAGYFVEYFPAAVMRHKGSTYGGKNRVVARLGMRNDLITVIKYVPAPSVFLFLAWKLWAHLRAVARRGALVDWLAVALALPRLWLRYRPGPKIERDVIWRFELLKYRPAASFEDSLAAPVGLMEVVRARSAALASRRG